MRHALIVTKGTFLARGEHFVPQCSLLCFLPHYTHTLTHMLLMDCSLTLSHSPSTPNPSMAHSASSASGRVAFILSIILSSPSVQFPNCSSFLLGEREKEANLYLPLICWLPWHITRRHCCICRANMPN